MKARNKTNVQDLFTSFIHLIHRHLSSAWRRKELNYKSVKYNIDRTKVFVEIDPLLKVPTPWNIIDESLCLLNETLQSQIILTLLPEGLQYAMRRFNLGHQNYTKNIHNQVHVFTIPSNLFYKNLRTIVHAKQIIIARLNKRWTSIHELQTNTNKTYSIASTALFFWSCFFCCTCFRSWVHRCLPNLNVLVKISPIKINLIFVHYSAQIFIP